MRGCLKVDRRSDRLYPESALSAAISPDGTMAASGSTDNTIKLWDVKTFHCLATLNGHKRPVWSLAFSLLRCIPSSCPSLLVHVAYSNAIVPVKIHFIDESSFIRPQGDGSCVVCDYPPRCTSISYNPVCWPHQRFRWQGKLFRALF